MAANSKYQPAPQRDSLDETSRYTQAPPSYQNDGNDPLLGPARSSEDNVPDDFKVGRAVLPHDGSSIDANSWTTVRWIGCRGHD